MKEGLLGKALKSISKKYLGYVIPKTRVDNKPSTAGVSRVDFFTNFFLESEISETPSPHRL